MRMSILTMAYFVFPDAPAAKPPTLPAVMPFGHRSEVRYTECTIFDGCWSKFSQRHTDEAAVAGQIIVHVKMMWGLPETDLSVCAIVFENWQGCTEWAEPLANTCRHTFCVLIAGFCKLLAVNRIFTLSFFSYLFAHRHAMHARMHACGLEIRRKRRCNFTLKMPRMWRSGSTDPSLSLFSQSLLCGTEAPHCFPHRLIAHPGNPLSSGMPALCCALTILNSISQAPAAKSFPLLAGTRNYDLASASFRPSLECLFSFGLAAGPLVAKWLNCKMPELSRGAC